jgi:hypothetical protein
VSGVLQVQDGLLLMKQFIAEDMYKSFLGTYFQSYEKKGCMAGFIKTRLLPISHASLCRLCPVLWGQNYCQLYLASMFTHKLQQLHSKQAY